jgi:hypothetical protein
MAKNGFVLVGMKEMGVKLLTSNPTSTTHYCSLTIEAPQRTWVHFHRLKNIFGAGTNNLTNDAMSQLLLCCVSPKSLYPCGIRTRIFLFLKLMR